MTTTRPRITTTKTEQWGVRKWPSENKIEHNSLNLQARSENFCIQVDHLDRYHEVDHLAHESLPPYQEIANLAQESRQLYQEVAHPLS